jgi:hypothetical protein
LIVRDSTTGEKRRTLVGHDGDVLRVVRVVIILPGRAAV